MSQTCPRRGLGSTNPVWTPLTCTCVEIRVFYYFSTKNHSRHLSRIHIPDLQFLSVLTLFVYLPDFWLRGVKNRIRVFNTSPLDGYYCHFSVRPYFRRIHCPNFPLVRLILSSLPKTSISILTSVDFSRLVVLYVKYVNWCLKPLFNLFRFVYFLDLVVTGCLEGPYYLTRYRHNRFYRRLSMYINNPWTLYRFRWVKN